MGTLCRYVVVVVVVVVVFCYYFFVLVAISAVATFHPEKKLSFLNEFAKVATGSTSPDYNGNHSKREEFVVKSLE